MDWDSDPELRQLRAEFVASFGERARVIKSSGPEEVLELAHKLAGAAATYGFPSIGQLSAALDDWISLRPGEANQESVAAYAEVLARALEMAEKTGSDDPSVLLDPVAKRLISEAEALVSGSTPGSS